MEDALRSADERDAGAGRGAEPVDEPVSAAVRSEPARGCAAAAEPVGEACSSAAEPVGEAASEAAVKSVGESCFAAAPAGGPCLASGRPGLQAEEALKCFEWRTAHCGGS